MVNRVRVRVTLTLTLTLTLLMLYIAHFKHLIKRKSHFLCKTSKKKKRNIPVNGNFRENIYKILNFRYFFFYHISLHISEKNLMTYPDFFICEKGHIEPTVP